MQYVNKQSRSKATEKTYCRGVTCHQQIIKKKSLEKEIKTAQMAHVTYGGETLLGCSEMQVRDLLIAAHHSDWDFPEHMLRKMQVLLPEFVAIVT